MLNIAYDRELSTEFDAKYFVYDNDGAVIYKGNYTQCLCVCGAYALDTDITLDEINEKSNGFIYEAPIVEIRK